MTYREAVKSRKLSQNEPDDNELFDVMRYVGKRRHARFCRKDYITLSDNIG